MFSRMFDSMHCKFLFLYTFVLPWLCLVGHGCFFTFLTSALLWCRQICGDYRCLHCRNHSCGQATRRASINSQTTVGMLQPRVHKNKDLSKNMRMANTDDVSASERVVGVWCVWWCVRVFGMQYTNYLSVIVSWTVVVPIARSIHGCFFCYCSKVWNSHLRKFGPGSRTW